MEKFEVKQFDIDEVDEITLLSIEEAQKVPQNVLACGDWWWLRSPGFYQITASSVHYRGYIDERGLNVIDDSTAVRPVFRISNLESEIGDKVMIGKTWCTVVDKELVLTDNPICNHRFDSESNNWETSELKAFINSEEFKAMI